MPRTTFLILRSPPKAGVSKDAKRDVQNESRISEHSLAPGDLLELQGLLRQRQFGR
jgi:hypothetical protein